MGSELYFTIVVHDPRVCHDLDPRSHLQGQDHSMHAHVLKICVRAITPLCQIGSGLYFTIVHDPRVCHDLDPRSRSQCTYLENTCPGHKSSLPSWIWVTFPTLMVLDPRVCNDLDPRSYLLCQGHSVHVPKICAQAITFHCKVGSG